MNLRTGTRKILVAAAAVALLLAIVSGATAAKPKKTTNATTTPAFCANPVDNYLAPVEALQRIPAVPEGGVLRYAPAGTTLSATGPQGLLVGGSSIGFRLTNAAPAATPTLKWTVLERLTRLTDKGQKPHPEGLKRIDLKALPAGKHRGLVFPLPTKPAVYSLEVTIQNHRGRLLGRYGEYVRVVERVANSALSLAAYDNLPPGGTLEACFENHGTAAVAPTGTQLERFDASTGAWRQVAQPPTYATALPLGVRTLGPGEAERIGVPIPARALPGLYKVLVTGTTDLGEPVVVGAEFGVL